MATITLKVITPDRVVYEGTVDQVTLPVTDGEVTILPQHRSYIASLTFGEIMMRASDEQHSIAVGGGFVEFADNTLTVLADMAVREEEVDLQKAEEARKRAEDVMNKVISTDETDYARVAAALEMELAKIRVAKKYLERKGLQ